LDIISEFTKLEPGDRLEEMCALQDHLVNGENSPLPKTIAIQGESMAMDAALEDNFADVRDAMKDSPLALEVMVSWKTLEEYKQKLQENCPSSVAKLDTPEADPNSHRLLTVKPLRDPITNPQDFAGWMKKWEAMNGALRDAGFNVMVLDSEKAENPKSVYVRDRYLKLGTHAVFPDTSAAPWDEETKIGRAHDSAALKKLLVAAGYTVHTTEGIWFETGDFIQDHEKNILFAGQRTPNDADRNGKLERWLGNQGFGQWQMVPLQIRLGSDDPNDPFRSPSSFYHLDLAMAERQNKNVVPYCEDVFTTTALHKLKQIYDKGELLEVSRADAEQGALNMKGMGNKIVPSYLSAAMTKAFSERGVTCLDPKNYGVENFRITNGGVHCATNEM
jgi:N-dimethylarginine dimethylaminohydrolase